MNCGKCGAPNEAGRARCDYCGTPLDQAPTPDAIAKLVEDKARQILEGERGREQHERQNAAEAERMAVAQGELATFRQSLDRMRDDLAKADAAPPRLFGLSKAPAIAYALVFAFVAAMVLPGPLVASAVAGACTGLLVSLVMVGWWRRSAIRRDRVMYAEAVTRLEKKVAEGERALGRRDAR
jgi:hypothetical protein